MSGNLTIRDLTVRVGGKALIEDISLDVRTGKVTGLLGPNGAGKSTLMRAILGLTSIAAGAILYAGFDLLAMSRRDRAQMAAFVEQSHSADVHLSAREVVLLGRIPFQSIWQSVPSPDDGELATAAISAVSMSRFADRDFSTLSGGEQQRLHIARALVQQPQLLILDEPTNHLDVQAQLSVLHLLREKAAEGMTVLIALHDLNLAAGFCDDLVLMNKGRVVATGAPEAVLTPTRLKSVYDVSASLLRHPATGRPIIAYDLLPPDGQQNSN
ncbi:MAG TPA: ATP-binding cassette domain-containing protein [Devosia sp.]|jgi:iron complex transport system ATP-binding protein|nr:ATP-binding cassette domain-containing protein [Devosia sp.]